MNETERKCLLIWYLENCWCHLHSFNCRNSSLWSLISFPF